MGGSANIAGGAPAGYRSICAVLQSCCYGSIAIRSCPVALLRASGYEAFLSHAVRGPQGSPQTLASRIAPMG